MKRYLMLAMVMVWGYLAVNAQNEGTASDRDGVVFYIESMPANQYRHLGTVQCATFSPDDMDPLLDHIIKQARKSYPEFDALILRSGMGFCKADVIQFYRDPKAKKSRGRTTGPVAINPEYKKSLAQPKNGDIVYIMNNPTNEFTMLGKIETPVTFRSKNVEELIAEIVRLSKERYPDLDAVVIIDGTNLRKANAIKYK